MALLGALLAAGLVITARAQSDFVEIVCPEIDGNYPNPNDCTKYISCTNKVPLIQPCPIELYWNDKLKRCVHKPEAYCERAEIATTTPDPYAAPECDTSQCRLPDCYCSKDGTRIPNDLNPEQVPQMVILTLDGAVNEQNYAKYQRIFNDTAYKNPNECPMRGTFFVSHEYTNYQMVQDLYAKGHEIAVNSVSSKSLAPELLDTWVQEVVGMQYMLERWANVSTLDIFGVRAPRLKPGGNEQFYMIQDYGFGWDSSVPVSVSRLPVWPYTLDYKIPHECKSVSCPTSSFPGIWEFPVNAHYNEGYDGGICPYLDQCVLFNYKPDDILTWFQNDFNRYYQNNRAPYLLSFKTNWFNEETLMDGLSRFLEWVDKKDDVWFVTMTQALFWMTNPTPISQLSTLDSWDCRKREFVPAPACNLPNKCKIPFKPPKNSSSAPGIRYFTTCLSCPKQLPWLDDYEGNGGPPDYYPPLELDEELV